MSEWAGMQIGKRTRQLSGTTLGSIAQTYHQLPICIETIQRHNQLFNTATMYKTLQTTTHLHNHQQHVIGTVAAHSAPWLGVAIIVIETKRLTFTSKLSLWSCD